MKAVIESLLPASVKAGLQRAKFRISLLKPYRPLPFTLSDLPEGEAKNAYASHPEKMTPAFQKTMAKLHSYVGAGPIGPNKEWEYPWVLRNLGLKPGLKILDAGCGRSPLQYFLAEMGMTVSGTDPNENVGWHGIDRRLAKKFGLSIDYRVEGTEKLSYPDETFDRVMCISVLEHCRATPAANDLITPQNGEDRTLQARMMRELARALKKGGLLIITLDIMFPRNGVILESNVDVRNLISGSGLTLAGALPAPGVYGDSGFNMEKLAAYPDLDVQNYEGVLGTSLGLIFRK